MLGGTRLQLIFVVGREVFRGGPLLDVFGSLQLLNSAHVREKDKAPVEKCDGRWCLELVSAGWGQGSA